MCVEGDQGGDGDMYICMCGGGRSLRFCVLGQETRFSNKGNQTPVGPKTIALLITGKAMKLLPAPTRG